MTLKKLEEEKNTILLNLTLVNSGTKNFKVINKIESGQKSQICFTLMLGLLGVPPDTP